MLSINRKREIRIKAEAFREKCKISRYGIIDLFMECDRCGFKLLRYPLGEEADLGFSMKRDNDIIIFTNTSSRLSREIFTLAHEIGHTRLHMEGADSFIDDAVTIADKSTDEKEQEANYFAVCLLMPADEVDKFLDLETDYFSEHTISAMDIARMMSEFNVSFETALNRLENLEKIGSREKIKLDNVRNMLRVGNLLKSVGGNNKLNEPSGVTSLPYEYIDYVIYNYNHKAIPKETLEKVLTCYGLSVDDISDKLMVQTREDDELDDLIGGLDD